MTPVGFEPTQLALVELESTPLDHSGKVSMRALPQRPYTHTHTHTHIHTHTPTHAHAHAHAHTHTIARPFIFGFCCQAELFCFVFGDSFVEH